VKTAAAGTAQSLATMDGVIMITQHLQAVPVPPSEPIELPIAATLERLR
jgi:hypothetical protein